MTIHNQPEKIGKEKFNYVLEMKSDEIPKPEEREDEKAVLYFDGKEFYHKYEPLEEGE
ncbi:MAG: hypothetical protein ACOCQD_05140 [archaeon]